MHNTLARVQNVFGFFTTVATAVAAAVAVASLLATPVPALKEGSVRLSNVQVVKGRPHYYTQKAEEYAHVKFDLDVDLSSLFTWNTKQVFLYITATYPATTSGGSKLPSRAIIWDAILPHPLAPAHHNHFAYPGATKPTSKSKSKPTSKPTSKTQQQKQKPGLLRLSSHRPKYQITDPSGRIASRPNATLELNWNAQPWVGALTWASGSGYPLGGFFGGAVSGGKGGGTKKRWWSTWRAVPGAGARTPAFEMPALKNRTEAARSAGGGGLDTQRGGEGNRGRPA